MGALGAALLAAGVLDFFLGRLLAGSLPAPPPGAMARPGRLDALRQAIDVPAGFAHALVAVLALATSCAAIAAALRDPSFAPPSRRLTVLVLAIFALPIVAISLVLPVRPQMVFIALTATAFQGVVLAAGAPRPGRALAVLLALPVLLGYADTLTRLVPWLSVPGLPAGLGLATEAAVVAIGLLAPFALVLFPFARARSASRGPILAALLVALCPTIAFGTLSVLAWPQTQSLSARAVGIDLQVPYAQPLYLAALFGYTATTAFHLWPRRHLTVVPEIGLGFSALLFGGCGPYTPFRISLLFLGLLLVAIGLRRLGPQQ